MVVLASFTQPTDGIRHRQNNTTVYVNDNNLGKGTLYIAESRLSWVSDSGNGFSIEYPHISLHAVSRDLSSFPQECLFLMLDTALGDENEKNDDGEDENENDNDSNEEETTELRLVPDDRGMLDAMFHAMNACQALHPDPEDSFSDEDFYEDADDEVPMEETGSQMANLSIGRMAGVGMAVGMEAGMGAAVAAGSIWGRGTSGAEVDMGEEGILDNMVEEGTGVEGTGAEGKEVEDTGAEDMKAEGTEVEGTGAEDKGVEDTGAEDMRVDTGVEGTGAEGTGVEDILDNMEVEEACTGIGMVQGGRAFALDSIWHRGNMAEIPSVFRHQMDPEEESNFADAEN